MLALEKLLHAGAIGLTGAAGKLMPDRIPLTFVGEDSPLALCESIAQAGVRRVLVVSDATLVELGLVDRIGDSLRAAGLDQSVYSGVEPDPTFDHVATGLDQLRRDGCDAVLALGGGSPIDAA